MAIARDAVMINREKLIEHVEGLIDGQKKRAEAKHKEDVRGYERSRRKWERFVLKRSRENLKHAEAGNFDEVKEVITNRRYGDSCDCDFVRKPHEPTLESVGNRRDHFLEMLRLSDAEEVKISAKMADEYKL